MPKKIPGAAPLIHPLAVVEKGVPLGEGTRVWQFTIVKNGTRIGRHCNIGAHCYIEGGTSLGDYVTVKNGVTLWEGVHLEDGVFVGPGAIFTNDVYPRSQRLPQAREPVISKTLLRYGCAVSAGAMVLAGVTLGRFATVGMGAVCLKSVPDHALVVGSPARQVGWVCECAMGLVRSRRRASTWLCEGCGRSYQLRRGRLEKEKAAALSP